MFKHSSSSHLLPPSLPSSISTLRLLLFPDFCSKFSPAGRSCPD